MFEEAVHGQQSDPATPAVQRCKSHRKTPLAERGRRRYQKRVARRGTRGRPSRAARRRGGSPTSPRRPRTRPRRRTFVGVEISARRNPFRLRIVRRWTAGVGIVGNSVRLLASRSFQRWRASLREQATRVGAGSALGISTSRAAAGPRPAPHFGEKNTTRQTQLAGTRSLPKARPSAASATARGS